MQNLHFSFLVTGQADDINEIKNVLAQLSASNFPVKASVQEVGSLGQTEVANDPAPEARAYDGDLTGVVPVAAPNYRTFGLNVYDSDTVAFALGKKVYRNAADAAAKRTRNGNWLFSFNLDIDLATGAVRSTANDRAADSVRYFAVLLGEGGSVSFSKGYDTSSAAHANNPDALAVIGVAIDDDSAWVL